MRKKKEEAHLVLSDPALAPDEDGLHLRRHHLHSGAGRARDAQLEGDAGVRGHAASLRIPAAVRSRMDGLEFWNATNCGHDPNCILAGESEPGHTQNALKLH